LADFLQQSEGRRGGRWREREGSARGGEKEGSREAALKRSQRIVTHTHTHTQTQTHTHTHTHTHTQKEREIDSLQDYGGELDTQLCYLRSVRSAVDDCSTADAHGADRDSFMVLPRDESHGQISKKERVRESSREFERIPRVRVSERKTNRIIAKHTRTKTTRVRNPTNGGPREMKKQTNKQKQNTQTQVHTKSHKFTAYLGRRERRVDWSASGGRPAVVSRNGEGPGEGERERV
jgi:hypothetical protein